MTLNYANSAKKNPRTYTKLTPSTNTEKLFTLSVKHTCYIGCNVAY